MKGALLQEAINVERRLSSVYPLDPDPEECFT